MRWGTHTATRQRQGCDPSAPVSGYGRKLALLFWIWAQDCVIYWLDFSPIHMNRYQTFWRRVLAGLIDGLVFIPIGFLSDYLFSSERSAPALIIWGVTYYSALWIYGVVLHACYGKTIGKMAMRIRVLDISEERIPTFRQAFARDIFYIFINVLSSVYFIYLVLTGEYVIGAVEKNMPGQIMTWAAIGWFLLEILSMITNKKRRAVHDYIAGTVVVKDV